VIPTNSQKQFLSPDLLLADRRSYEHFGTAPFKVVSKYVVVSHNI